jgi:predicted metal-dependent enzyme (double-stranded beta helix superfamily)
MYLYEPGDFSPVHDHNAWGLTTCIAGQLLITPYVRLDDGSRPGYARLREDTQKVLSSDTIGISRNQTNGIHATGNPGVDTAAMLSIYGPPRRRSYINGFDPVNNRIYRIYPPRLRMKRLAGEVLKAR